MNPGLADFGVLSAFKLSNLDQETQGNGTPQVRKFVFIHNVPLDIHIYIYMCMYICVCMYIYICVYVYIYIDR